MQIGITGLGRMGMGITKRLLRNGHQVVAHNRSPGPVEEAVAAGAIGASSLADLVSKLKPPRVVWIMLPDGAVTENAVHEAASLVSKGDIVIDGGNTNFHDDIRRAKILKEKGVNYVDIGTSGGVWGLERGFCMMVGGDVDAVKILDPILKTLAPGLGSIDRTARDPNADPRAEQGYIHAGPAGAGHFVKMVHNGIEYGVMQAFAEGFDIMRCRNSDKLPADQRFDLNMADIAEVWRRGSVVSSWLLDLTASALAKDPALNEFTGVVSDSGEGRWTIEAAIEEAVPANVLSAALYARFRSRQSATYGDKILSAMRKGFGGHVEPK
ncbi:MAG: phosphogluconate dehydrogenase (NAD(+)-dependent, decarboxylating) [Pseudomonadota bacterium]